MEPSDSLDRRLGRTVREWLAAVPGGPRAATIASDALAPVFTAVVVGLLARPAGRRAGLQAGIGAVAAAGLARVLRDGIGRPRPGDRADGGFPSRHAAASVAIARAVCRNRPRVGRVLGPAAMLGLAGRVATGEHDPGDILAGAALGWYVDAIVARLGGARD